MSRKIGFMDIVDSVEEPAETSFEALAGANAELSLKMAAVSKAGPRFKLRTTGKIYEIPRDRYFDLHTEIVNTRKDKPIYIEEHEDHRLSRILVPQLRRVAEIRVGPFKVELRAHGSPLRLAMARDLFEKFEGLLREAEQSKNQILITDDPDTHEILDVSPPFDRRAGGALPEEPRVEPAPLSLRRAIEEFEFLADAQEIPFDFPDEFCNARAHQMFRRLRARQVPCEKIWNYGGDGEPLNSGIRVFTLNHSDGLVAWIFHVALVVKVRLPNPSETVVDMVFDPALVNHPIRIPDWVALQHDSTAVQDRTPPEIFDQEIGGKNRIYDRDFRETEGSLAEARRLSWYRRLSLLEEPEERSAWFQVEVDRQ